MAHEGKNYGEQWRSFECYECWTYFEVRSIDSDTAKCPLCGAECEVRHRWKDRDGAINSDKAIKLTEDEKKWYKVIIEEFESGACFTSDWDESKYPEEMLKAIYEKIMDPNFVGSENE